MNEYNFSADLLNKFLQLTPWVQSLIGLAACGVFLGFFYFFKESVAAIMKPFCKVEDGVSKASGKKEEEIKGKDKYYRDGEAR